MDESGDPDLAEFFLQACGLGDAQAAEKLVAAGCPTRCQVFETAFESSACCRL